MCGLASIYTHLPSETVLESLKYYSTVISECACVCDRVFSTQNIYVYVYNIDIYRGFSGDELLVHRVFGGKFFHLYSLTHTRVCEMQFVMPKLLSPNLSIGLRVRG